MQQAADGEHRIVVENLYKVFGKNPERGLKLVQDGKTKEEVLEATGQTVGVCDASFEVRAGEIFVVMGLSGSGKSTLVRMLNRLINPTAGHVYVDGQDVATMNKEELINLRRRDMCMVFQSFALMPHMSVQENVAFGLEMSSVAKAEREKRAMEALEQVGLAPYAQSMPGELSGGMQQRVGLARGLAVNPSILLMDEAFSALDPLIRTEMQDELLTLQEEQQRTIVFISHDLDEAMRIGDRIAIMEGGRIVQVGTPEEILQNPADDYVKAFFRGVDPTNILTAGDIVRDNQVTFPRHKGEGPRAVLERLNIHDREFAYIVNPKRQYLGVVSTDTLKDAIDKGLHGAEGMEHAYIDAAKCVRNDATMQDILPLVANDAWPVPVTTEAGKYLGAISKNLFLRTLHRSSDAELEATYAENCTTPGTSEAGETAETV